MIIITFWSKCRYKSSDNNRILSVRSSGFPARSCANCAISSSTSLSLFCASSKVSPSTPLKERKITGYFPIYSAHISLFFEIYSPSNKDGSTPVSKKARSILIFSVFPKRRGRVKRFTFPQFCKSCSMSFVLST